MLGTSSRQVGAPKFRRQPKTDACVVGSRACGASLWPASTVAEAFHTAGLLAAFPGAHIAESGRQTPSKSYAASQQAELLANSMCTDACSPGGGRKRRTSCAQCRHIPWQAIELPRPLPQPTRRCCAADAVRLPLATCSLPNVSHQLKKCRKTCQP